MREICKVDFEDQIFGVPESAGFPHGCPLLKMQLIKVVDVLTSKGTFKAVRNTPGVTGLPYNCEICRLECSPVFAITTGGGIDRDRYQSIVFPVPALAADHQPMPLAA